ncbi:NUDIX domain-containing protein [Streptomyces sp. NPDC006906]|uniref:NUDIX hydrolase n=1 Tax=unclassified Streptomyces TaxID=2593676 RepID=UPI0033E29701
MGEFVERVDLSDEVVGVVERALAVQRRWLYRMAMVICRDAAGRYLVHRRPTTVSRFPGQCSWMVAGAVSVGESYADAARRELGEEMGVDSDVRFLFKFLCDGAMSPYWFAVHEAVIDPADVYPSVDEVAWHGWLSPEELRRDVEAGPYVPDSVDAFHRYMQWAGQ